MTEENAVTIALVIGILVGLFMLIGILDSFKIAFKVMGSLILMGGTALIVTLAIYVLITRYLI